MSRNALTSAVIELATQRLQALVDAAHAGRPIEIDGITYVPKSEAR